MERESVFSTFLDWPACLKFSMEQSENFLLTTNYLPCYHYNHCELTITITVTHSDWIPVNSPTCKLAYKETCLRTNSPTTCQLAYIGEFTHVYVMYAFYNFVIILWTMSKILFRLAQHWMKERGISCMASSFEFIYLTAYVYVARQWIKERRITHFTQLWGTTNSPMMVIKFAYVGEFTSRRRRVCR